MKKIKVGDYVETKCGECGIVLSIDDKYVYIPTNDRVLRQFSDRVGFPLKDIVKHKSLKEKSK